MLKITVYTVTVTNIMQGQYRIKDSVLKLTRKQKKRTLYYIAHKPGTLECLLRILHRLIILMAFYMIKLSNGLFAL